MGASIMPDLIALRAANADRWAHAKLTRSSEFSPVAKLLCAPAAKQRYLAVSARTGVPWFVIAVNSRARMFAELDALDRAGRFL